MQVLLYMAIVLAVFAFMEFMAWFTHKYIMHGWLWSLHEDHHVPHDHTLEKNDFFALIFAIPSITLLYLGSTGGYPVLISIGLGILLYGLAYFFVHDIYVHRRIRLFQNLDNQYLRAVRIAHKMHHKHLDRTPGESYGFLWVGRKYWQMAKERERRTKTS